MKHAPTITYKIYGGGHKKNWTLLVEVLLIPTIDEEVVVTLREWRPFTILVRRLVQGEDDVLLGPFTAGHSVFMSIGLALEGVVQFTNARGVVYSKEADGSSLNEHLSLAEKDYGARYFGGGDRR